MHHKRGRPRNRRSGRKLCRPWKVNGFRTKRIDGEKFSEHGRLVVRAARTPRVGWAEAAKAMHSRGDDHLLDAQTSTRFDDKDW